jgi:hypothetical protein
VASDWLAPPCSEKLTRAPAGGTFEEAIAMAADLLPEGRVVTVTLRSDTDAIDTSFQVPSLVPLLATLLSGGSVTCKSPASQFVVCDHSIEPPLVA